MVEIARRVMLALGFDHGQFNIEFIYNPPADTIHIIEINPRMSSQFADLFEKVDGTNSYSVLLDLALGNKPQVNSRRGKHSTAFSCVLRTFQNQRILKLPSRDEIRKLQTEFPDMRIEILATEGRKLSQQMQDTCSYRYGLLNIRGTGQEEILAVFDYCRRRLRSVLNRSELNRHCHRENLITKIFTTLLGLVMAFRFVKNKTAIALTLAAGIATPILLLYLGEGAKKQVEIAGRARPCNILATRCAPR